MSGEERKALSFVAILLGLSVVARAVNRPEPMVLAGAANVDIQARLQENQQVRTRTTTPRKPPAPAPRRRAVSAPVVIDNRPPKGGPATLLNLNRATAAELDALPGISPAVAQRIVEYRTARGMFTSVEELDSVKGIGPAVLARVRPLVKLR